MIKKRRFEEPLRTDRGLRTQAEDSDDSARLRRPEAASASASSRQHYLHHAPLQSAAIIRCEMVVRKVCAISFISSTASRSASERARPYRRRRAAIVTASRRRLRRLSRSRLPLERAFDGDARAFSPSKCDITSRSRLEISGWAISRRFPRCLATSRHMITPCATFRFYRPAATFVLNHGSLQS